MPYRLAPQAKQSWKASALSVVKPPALLPRMTSRRPSTSPRATRCCAPWMQSTTSTTPHKPSSRWR
jgi:hypothetical protein